jgi:hypothetical protein
VSDEQGIGGETFVGYVEVSGEQRRVHPHHCLDSSSDTERQSHRVADHHAPEEHRVAALT